VYEGIGAGGDIKSFNNTLRDNVVNKVGRYGMWVLSDSGGSLIENNTVKNATSKGFYLGNIQNSKINNNSIEHSGSEGIHLTGAASVSNALTSNLVVNSESYGLKIGGEDNLVQDYTFIDNNKGIGKQATQFSPTTNNITHNHWNDWTSPDENGDGIVDIPYVLDGFDAQDNFPLVSPTRKILATSFPTSAATSFNFVISAVLAFGLILFIRKVKNRPKR
jgi:parallel beta-helix repeat protein